jgi:hypothetical protein
MQKLDFAICCDDEKQRILSNWRGLETWEALENLLDNLMKGSSSPRLSILYAWKKGQHQSSAKEPYAWRSALEEIKNSDLFEMCAQMSKSEEKTLMTDKPAMLKIAGEITNSLMHSYEAHHKISFIQRESKVPF